MICRMCGCALICLAAWLACAMPVFAHAKIVRALPMDGSVSPLPPREVQLWFTEPIVPEFSSVKLIDASGHQTTLNQLHLDATDQRILFARVPSSDPLPDGVYNLTWNVLASDGHYTRGYSIFGVGNAVLDAATSATSQAEPIPAPGEIALRAITYSLLVLQVGSVISLIWIFREADLAHRRAYLCAAVSAGLLVVIGIVWLVWQSRLLIESLGVQSALIDAVRQLLAQTQWGAFWLMREALALTLFILLIRNQMLLHGGQWIALAGVLALCTAQAGIGHSASLIPVSAIAIASATVHIFAGGIWMGGLATLFIALQPRLVLDAQATHAFADERWLKFSSQALFGVILIGVTGIYNTARQVQSVDALIGTLYGQALMIKVVLVCVVAVLGLINTTRLHPTSALARILYRTADHSPLTPNHLGRSIFFELCVGVLVILATSLLTAAAPAHGPEFVTPMASTSPNQISDDMLIVFSVKPNRPGQNLFVVEADSTRRPEPAPIARVILKIRNKDTDLGLVTVDASKIDKNRYQVGGNYMSLSGQWQVEVVVRRKGLEDVSTTFDWIVPSSAIRPIRISSHVWEPELTVVSLIVAIVGVVLMALVYFRQRSFS